MDPLETDEGLLHEPDIDAILREVFGLSHNAIVICIVVIERGPITTEEIAEVVDVSSSTVSNVLRRLVAAGILERYERNLKRGGTVKVYEAVSLDAQQRIYRRALYQWVRSAIEEINGFDVEALKEQYRSDEPGPGPTGERAAVYWDSGRDPPSSK